MTSTTQGTPARGDIFWHDGQVTRAARERRQGHLGATLWLTGLSASGKSTLARALEVALFDRGCNVVVLDGDNVRLGLNRDLGFSPSDRTENIRRIAEVAKLFVDAGTLVVTAFISPYRADREAARAVMTAGDFIEIFVDCEIAVCEARDPKGLYRRARSGELREFTGVSAPYEAPERAEVTVHTDRSDLGACVAQLVGHLERGGYLSPAGAGNGARA